MKKIGFILLTFLSFASFSAQDVEFTYNLIGGEKSAGDKNLNEWVHEIVLRYFGNYRLSEKFGLLLSEEFDGITTATNKFPGRNINHPVKSRASLGLEFTGLGRMQIKGFSQAFINSLENDFPVWQDSKTHLVDATMVQRFKNSADFYWEIPINRMNIMANVLYNNLLYDYYRLGDVEPDQYESDLWFNGSLAFSLVEEKLKILCRGIAKHDFNEYSGYNLANILFGIGSDFILFKRKVKGTGEILARYYTCSIMDERGYADQLGLVSHLRLLYRLKPRMFLKSDLEYEVAPASGNEWYIKQRYELAFRKAWKNLSAIEAGGWGTFGTLFPRVCGYATGDIAVIPKLDIIPAVRVYWMWEERVGGEGVPSETTELSSGYSFYRTDVELMLRYKIGSENSNFFKNFALHCGAEYKLFDWDPVPDPPFVNTLRLFIGMTNYL